MRATARSFSARFLTKGPLHNGIIKRTFSQAIASTTDVYKPVAFPPGIGKGAGHIAIVEGGDGKLWVQKDIKSSSVLTSTIEKRTLEMFIHNLAREVFSSGKTPEMRFAIGRGIILSEIINPNKGMDLLSYIFEYVSEEGSNRRVPKEIQEAIIRAVLFKFITADRDIKPGNFVMLFGSKIVFPIDAEYSQLSLSGRQMPGFSKYNHADVERLFDKAMTVQGIKELLFDTNNIYNNHTSQQYDLGVVNRFLFPDVDDKFVVTEMGKMIMLLNSKNSSATQSTNQHIKSRDIYERSTRIGMSLNVEGYSNKLAERLKSLEVMYEKKTGIDVNTLQFDQRTRVLNPSF